jgi:hypothetical protein
MTAILAARGRGAVRHRRLDAPYSYCDPDGKKQQNVQEGPDCDRLVLEVSLPR